MKKSIVTKEIKVCEHCGKEFTSLKIFQKHKCATMKRLEAGYTEAGKLALSIFNFYLVTYHPAVYEVGKEYREFIKSYHYKLFIKFAEYCLDIKAVEPLKYCEYLMTNKVKSRDWMKDSQYSRYLKWYIREEDPYYAIERSVINLMKECDLRGLSLTNAFVGIHPNRICSMVANGSVSPWLLYQSKSGKNALAQMNEGQVSLIYEYIDPPKWALKFNRQAKIVIDIQQIFTELKL